MPGVGKASLLLVLGIVLTACSVSLGTGEEQEINAGTGDQQREVVAAARRVAGHLDEGRYGEVWASTGPMLRSRSTQEQFIANLVLIRKPLGRGGQRDIRGFSFPTELEGHTGEFGLVALGTDFERLENVEEKFVFQRIESEWKLVGYFVSTTVTLGDDDSAAQ